MPSMPTEFLKTLTYLAIHLSVGFTVAYLMTGSVEIAGGIALVEPCVNAVAFFFHERAWKRDWRSLFAGRGPRLAA